ncbi:hypothetical protein C5E46_04120 [Nocardia nova]|nr:hypothetical protein C5E46_04120 [Nocardia nova]
MWIRLGHGQFQDFPGDGEPGRRCVELRGDSEQFGEQRGVRRDRAGEFDRGRWHRRTEQFAIEGDEFGQVALEQELPQLGRRRGVVQCHRGAVGGFLDAPAGERIRDVHMLDTDPQRFAHGSARHHREGPDAVCGKVIPLSGGQAQPRNVAQAGDQILDHSKFLCGANLAVRVVEHGQGDAGAVEALLDRQAVGEAELNQDRGTGARPWHVHVDRHGIILGQIGRKVQVLTAYVMDWAPSTS